MNLHIEKLPYSLKFIGIEKSKEQASVYARIIIKRKKAEFSIGIIGETKDWDESIGKFQVTKPYNNYLNNKITEAEGLIYNYHQNLKSADIEITAQNIKKLYKGDDSILKSPLLTTFVDEIIDFKSKLTDEISEGTMEHYKKMKLYLLEFLKLNDLSGMRIEEWKRKHFVSFETFLLTRKNETLNRPISRATVNKNLSKLKAVINEALSRELIIADPTKGFKMDRVESTRTYLSLDEIRKIESHDLLKNDSLIKVRSIFLFSVYTGIRFCDAINLKRTSIFEESDGSFHIRYNQKKTRKDFNVPMLRQAIEIYEYNIIKYPDSDFVLPKISNQKTNLYLKEIAKLCNIKTNLTHHVARHTFATSVFLDQGVDLKATSFFLGHSSIKSTEKYAKITKIRAADVVKNLDKLV